MKIKTLIAVCFFIMALFTTTASMAQSVVPTTRNIEIREGNICETEIMIYTNGFRAISRSYTSNNPDIVAITEIRYYDFMGGVIRWLFNITGKRFGVAVITTAVAFIDEYGNDILIQETIHVSVKWGIELRQALSASTDTTSGDAIKEED